jgi:integrase
MTLELLAEVLSDAVRRGLIPANPAADPDLRLKVTRRRGNFLEADELLAVIDAAGALDAPVGEQTIARAESARRLRADGRTWTEIGQELGVAQSTAIWLAGRRRVNAQPGVRRAIVATLGAGGLRNSELCELNLADLDFAHGIIRVRDAKTEAGVRQVNMSPWLRDELLAYRATRPQASSEEPAFPTRSGSRREKNNVNRRVIAPAVRLANEQRSARQQPPLPEAVTPHTLRRTFITLMLEAGAPVPYVQAQVGHDDPTTTLQIYAQVLRRRDRRRHGEAFDALMSGAVPTPPLMAAEHPERLPALPGGSGHSGT